MTRQILFVQGGGEGAHDAWDDKLVASLRRELGPGYDIRYPRMPHEADPAYVEWKPALKEAITALDGGAIMVGHSIGGTMLINALTESEETPRISAIILIAAPFVGKGGWPSDEIVPMSDIGDRLASAPPVYLFQGGDDETTPAAHVDLYAKALPHASVRKLKGRDHQLNNDLAEVAEVIRGLA